MKKNILKCTVVLLLLVACQQGPVRYTQNSPEIETIKKLIDNYDNKAYGTSMYADTSKTYYNTKDNPMSAVETMEYHKEAENVYSSRGFEDEHQEFEMVVTDDGETWVNCWLDWKGSLAANGKEMTIPVHLTFQFVEGKIVREYGYWDPSQIVLELQKIAAEAKMAETEQTE